MSTVPGASPTHVLGDRSPNTSSPVRMHHSMESKHNPDMVKTKISEIKATQEQTYISPSDTVLSPTSKKLSEIKGKRFANVKSRSLFAKTVSKEGLKSQEKVDQAEKD